MTKIVSEGVLLMNTKYSEEIIRKAEKIGIENAEAFPKAEEGFWFEGVYIVSIFLDKTGRKPLTLDESIEYYGMQNVHKYMSAVRKANYDYLSQ